MGARMAEHEPCIGATSDWFTPFKIFEALDLEFELDPCSPGPEHWAPAKKIYTIKDDGLWTLAWHNLSYARSRKMSSMKPAAGAANWSALSSQFCARGMRPEQLSG